MAQNRQRNFLFLQGPHGPFLNRLGKMLRRAGADVTRVGFNAGDQFFWRDKASFVPFTQSLDKWPAVLSDLLSDKEITDMRAYKDYRRFLLETSQIPGGFYSSHGRRQLLRHLTDMVLADDDPYDALKTGRSAPRRQLKVVS